MKVWVISIGYLNSTVLIWVPQKRKRVFIIGIKPSEFSHELLDLNIKSCKKEVTLREAIDDLPILSNGNSIDVLEYKKKSNLTNYQILMRKKNPGNYVSNNLVSKNKDYVIERFKHIKMGENWKSIPKNLMMINAIQTIVIVLFIAD